MTDTRSPEQRRRIMQSVRTKNTGPELAVRSALFRLGYRYRVHAKGLPGKPDLVFPGRRKIIFIHGCYWHGHECNKGRLAKSRLDYWAPKINANRQRDFEREKDLRDLGWKVHVVWQCELSDTPKVVRRLVAYLGPVKISIDS